MKNKGVKSDPKEKKGDGKRDDKKQQTHPHAARNKLRTEGVTELKYDRFSATSFANFEKDLRLVAGQEFGDLFGYVIEGVMPPEELPEPTSVESNYEDELHVVYEIIKSYEDMDPDSLTEREQRAKERAVERKEWMIQEYTNMSAAKKTLKNIALQEKYKAEVKEAISRQKKFQNDAPKLYWLIRRNMSEESTNKIREHLKEEWEESERQQDPVSLWRAIKLTHTAYSTGNPFTDKQQLRQAYSEMKMYPTETLLNLKLRFTTALRAMEAVNIDIPSEEDQASDFVAKLDQRWASLRSQLANDFARGIRGSQPKTLMEAYILASQWKVVVTNSQGQSSTVFATSIAPKKAGKDDQNDKKGEKKGGGKEEAKNKTEKISPKNGCHLCQGPHFMKDCPLKVEFDKIAGKKNETPNNPTPSQGTQRSDGSNQNET